MPSLAELSLPDLPINAPEFALDPAARFAEARRAHPWLARSDLGYVITECAAGKDILGDDAHMRIAVDDVLAVMKAEGSPWGGWMKRNIIVQQGEAHRRVRDVLAPMFTPRAANRHRALMRQVISQLLDEWAPKARIDFEEFASCFPVTVMCGIIGASPEALPRLRSSLEALGLSYSMLPETLPDLDRGYGVIDAFATELVAARRAGERLHAEEDLLDALIAAADAGDLSAREVNDLLIFLFAAGYDTSKNVLTLLMHHLTSRPQIYARCAEDRAYCNKVVEEGLRYTSPSNVPRLVWKDTAYRGVDIPKGTTLFIPVSILGRDPASFPDPDDFDPERTNEVRHLAFGRGLHLCLGQFIARAQLEEGLHLIAQRMTKPKSQGPLGWRSFTGVWGIRGLPIEFTPAPARAAEAAAIVDTD
jgi:cytochrome P450